LDNNKPGKRMARKIMKKQDNTGEGRNAKVKSRIGRVGFR